MPVCPARLESVAPIAPIARADSSISAVFRGSGTDIAMCRNFPMTPPVSACLGSTASSATAAVNRQRGAAEAVGFTPGAVATIIAAGVVRGED
jgi:hypothetical protein